MKETNSKFVKHIPCDACGSSDANSLWSDDHTYCYSCERYTHGNTKRTMSENEHDERMSMSNELVDINDSTVVGPLLDRGVTADSCRHYGVRVTLEHGQVTEHWYPYHDKDGDLTSYKKRVVKTKQFPQYGDTKAGLLFGQSKFTSGGKYITLCEGEIDTLSAFQMTGSKFPCVGVKSSSEAYKNCKKSFEYLDSFENIIIAFDNDEAGQKAAHQVASLFPKKVKIVKLKEGKDINWYLQESKEQEYTSAWWSAERFKPDDILSGFDTMWEIAKQPRRDALFQYPWDGVNKLTYGLRPSEMVVITAGSGMGKTQFLREITHHALKTTEENIGTIYLEETAWETAMGIASVEGNKPFHLPDTHYTENELRQAYENTWGTDRLHTLNDKWRDNDVTYITDKIKYLAKGMDCRMVILDHISFMVSDNPGDERKMLDEIAHKLKAIAVELDICLLAVCHSKRQATKPHEEGGTTSLSDLRGTAGIGQLSNIVLGLERNGQADDPTERNTTLIRVLKNRFSGKTGPTSRVLYDEFTGRLNELIGEDE